MYEIALFELIVSEMFPLNTVEVLRARVSYSPKRMPGAPQVPLALGAFANRRKCSYWSSTLSWG